VEIYHKNKRIALHRREKHEFKYSTSKEHMPPHHRFYHDWSPERFLKWASGIGAQVEKIIAAVFASCKNPEQGFKTSLGILNLEKKYGNTRLNSACEYALNYEFHSYKKIKNTLDKGLALIQEESLFDSKLPEHENVRGYDYYAGY
jgi:transposase